MALKLRPTGLGSGIDKERQDFSIYSGDWAMGRIYEQRGGPTPPRHRPSLGPTHYWAAGPLIPAGFEAKIYKSMSLEQRQIVLLPARLLELDGEDLRLQT
jgi:hypothetical protein